MNIYNLHSNPEQLVGFADRFSNYTFLSSELRRIEKNLEYYAGDIDQDDFDELIDTLVLELPEEAINGINQYPELVKRLEYIEDGQL